MIEINGKEIMALKVWIEKKVKHYGLWLQ